MPDTMQPAPLPSVYQLRVVVRGVSPLIWRRLLVPADTTIAGLHAVLQIAFCWTGTHLHRFVVHGREYGIAYPDGPSFRDDPRKVRLGNLGLRTTERFTYHYNFTAGWCHDLRVEQVLGAEPGRGVPVVSSTKTTTRTDLVWGRCRLPTDNGVARRRIVRPPTIPPGGAGIGPFVVGL